MDIIAFGLVFLGGVFGLLTFVSAGITVKQFSYIGLTALLALATLACCTGGWVMCP